MRNSSLLRHAGSAFAMMVALSACSSSQSALPNPNDARQAAPRASALEPAARTLRGPLVYISDELGNFIDVFRKDGTLAGRITTALDYPVDLYVDGAHNLWVANQGSEEVLKFRRGSMTPSIYHDAGSAYAPSTCANGTLYVAAFSGTIAIFARGHHRPTGSLQENEGAAISMTCDGTGNLFAATTLLSPPGDVVEFPAGSTQARLLPIYLPNPVDVKPDPAGNLLVLDSAGGSDNAVSEYTEAGQATGKSMPTDANWSEMAISPNGKEIFGSDVNALDGSLRAFPSGKQLQTYQDSRFRQLGGIAYDPG